MTYPRMLEAKLRRELHRMLGKIMLAAKECQSYSKKEIANTRTDSPEDLYAMEASFARLQAEADALAKETEREAKKIGLQISLWNKKQQQRLLNPLIATAAQEVIFGAKARLKLRLGQEGLGPLEIDLFGNEPWLLDQLAAYNSQTSSLIKSLAKEQVDKVSGAVFRAMQSGDSWRDVAEEIKEGVGICERRANLIARDQVAKLNGALTRHRQMEVGIEQYIWRTSMDERVRPTHRANEGKMFSWRDAPANTGHNHPGGDYQCRCTAEPVVNLGS
jgi:SPP1 gp7 family putative phage head morphogenesis protein